MGLFGDDKLQDQRIEALEKHIRRLTETVQANQVDLAAGWISILSLQAQIDEKISADEVDPTMGKLNQQLGEARIKYEETSAAAAESWATLQNGVHQSFETLRTSIHDAADRLKSD